MKSGNKQH